MLITREHSTDVAAILNGEPGVPIIESMKVWPHRLQGYNHDVWAYSFLTRHTESLHYVGAVHTYTYAMSQEEAIVEAKAQVKSMHMAIQIGQ